MTRGANIFRCPLRHVAAVVLAFGLVIAVPHSTTAQVTGAIEPLSGLPSDDVYAIAVSQSGSRVEYVFEYKPNTISRTEFAAAAKSICAHRDLKIDRVKDAYRTQAPDQFERRSQTVTVRCK